MSRPGRLAEHLRVHALDVFSGLQGWAIWTPAARRLLFRLAGYRFGPGVRIMQGVYVGGRDLHLGAGVLVAARCHLGGGGRLVLEDGVTLSPNVLVTTSSHRIGGARKRCGDHYTADVTIGAGAWLGAGVTVLPGVRVGEGAVVAAGAVVAHDLEPDGFHAGAPAKMIRRLER